MAAYVYNDGGRAVAGFAGKTGDCVTRSIAIATGKPYQEVYDALNELAKLERPRRGWKSGKRTSRSTSRNGVHRRTYERFLTSLGWRWTPTMQVGSGCKVHLRADELPSGRLVVAVSRHMVAVIDGVVHDTHDPSRDGTRCVYGYYQAPDSPKPQLDDAVEVIMGEGIVEVLQLDDGGVCKHFGITWDHHPTKPKAIIVRGTRRALRVFQTGCSAAGDIEGPMWYARSSTAAMAAIAKVIGPLMPGWFYIPAAERDATLEAFAASQMERGT